MSAFENLASIIRRIQPLECEGAKLSAELDDGWSSIDLRFRDRSGNETMSQLPNGSGFQLHMTLDEIREEMARESGQRWVRCEFELDTDGRFRFNVSYPD